MNKKEYVYPMKVKCINAADKKFLTVGNIYPARGGGYNSYIITDDGDDGEHPYPIELFEVVEIQDGYDPEQEYPLKLKCIKNDGVKISLDIGKVYKGSIPKDAKNGFNVIDESGLAYGYLADMFEIVEVNNG